jgi:hypothetical protein
MHSLVTAVSVAGALTLGAAALKAQEIQLCDDKLYRRPCYTVRRDIADLRRSGIDNKTSSLRVSGGAWMVCNRPNFRGACRTFTQSIGDLRNTEFQDNISSVRRVGNGGGGYNDGNGGGGYNGGNGGGGYNGGNGGGGYNGGNGGGGYNGGSGCSTSGRESLVLFEDRVYRGSCLSVTGSVGDLSNFRNRASSVRVVRGRWKLCTGLNFRGACQIVSSDRPLLGSDYDNRIMSAQQLSP